MNIRDAIKGYNWYHEIEVEPAVFTVPANCFRSIWDFILTHLEKVHFPGRGVLDVGCRDGLFSFKAEGRDASRVVGIDNDLSPGAVNLLIPHFKSKVQMHEMNLYNLRPETFGQFDITMMFGVLYHLRYPFNGLRCVVNATIPGGLILIEAGMLCGFEHLPMLYCPWIDSPYEAGSPSFFNRLGLERAMESMGCTLETIDYLYGSDTTPGEDRNVRRGFSVFRRTHEMPKHLEQYWEGLHCLQSGPDGTAIRKF